MEESLISIGTAPYFKEEAEENFKMFSQIFKDCQDIRRCGSASLDLVHVACGRIDGYMDNHLKLWDKESIWDHIALAVIIVIVYTYVTKEGSEYSGIHGASKRH